MKKEKSTYKRIFMYKAPASSVLSLDITNDKPVYDEMISRYLFLRKHITHIKKLKIQDIRFNTYTYLKYVNYLYTYIMTDGYAYIVSDVPLYESGFELLKKTQHILKD